MPGHPSQRHKEALSPAKRRPSGSHSSGEEVGRRLARNPSSPPARVSSPLAPGFQRRLRRLGALQRRSPWPARSCGPRSAKTAALVQSQGEWPAGTAGGRSSRGPGLGPPGLEAGGAQGQGYSGDASDLREGPACCGPGCVRIWTEAPWCVLPAI